MPYFSKRLTENFIVQFFVSALATAALYVKLVPSGMKVCIMVLCMLIYILHLFICLKDYIKSIHGRAKYYRTNGIVLGIFAVLSILVALYSETWFKWLFFPYGLLAQYGMDRWASALIMNLIPYLILFLVHLRYLLKREQEKNRIIENRINQNYL